MTYTINQDVDVNASVDIGNIQVSTNTISSTDTNGDIILSPNGSGYVGIGTASPDSELHINGNISLDAFGADGNGIYFRDGYNSGNDPYNLALVVKDWRGGTTTTDGLLMSGYYGIGFMTQSNTYNASNVRMFIDVNGYVGVGTNDPKARLHVTSVNTGQTLSSGSRRYFKYDTNLSNDTATWTFNDVSVYGNGDIITNGYMLSHSATTFSDSRIKNSIVDIDDDSALNTLRLIKPKRYNYTDTVLKGSEPVWGFIAQEVSSVMDYAVSKITKEIPNVYKQAIVTNGNILTIDGFDTSSLSNDTEGNLVTKLLLKTYTNKDIEVTIDTILSSNSLRITTVLENEDINGTVDNIPFTNEIFVYGQIVDDFHALKKDAIFTISVAALQEVDRRQTTDNERILELENENSLQEERITTLEAQVAALLQHTGVTI